MKIRCLASAASLMLAGHCSWATEIGLSTDPMGSAWNRGDAGSAFATWDIFSATSFTNDRAGSSFGITLPQLDQSSAFTNFAMGAGLYQVLSGTPSSSLATNDVLFPGGNGVSFTITGEVDFSVHGFTLQIKRSGSAGGLQPNFSPTLTINGSAPITFDGVFTTSGGGDTSGDSGTWSVTTWTWSNSLAGIPETGSGTFSVSFANAGLQRGIDGIFVDVGSLAPAAVPEPATWLSLGTGLAFLLIVHRRHSPVERMTTASLS